ncbi:hypothetical protein AB0D46_06515 [Streptomyces sp. NPDC048383]|uniref:hypothetical protein n=1 Tax=Streptomyces sp. NPDC048383 TaxID=3155386 RepID=UPI00344742F8
MSISRVRPAPRETMGPGGRVVPPGPFTFGVPNVRSEAEPASRRAGGVRRFFVRDPNGRVINVLGQR